MSKAYTLKMRGGCEVDSKGKRAGKGALIQEELAMTLGVTQDQYLFQPIENYRADGIIGGGVAFNILSDHENRTTDMTNIVIQEIISIDRAAFNQGENAKYDFSISGGGTLKH